MSDTYFLIFGTILSLLGVIILFTVIYNLCTCKKKVDATISSLHIDKTTLRGSTVYSYSPIVTYEVNGSTYEARANFSTGRKDKYTVGNKMPLYINPSDPNKYRFPGKAGLWITGFAFLIIGLLFVILYFA